MRVVKLQREQFEDPPPPFRTGEAGLVTLSAGGELETPTRVRLSANSVHALLGHGVVEVLNGLAIEGEVGGGVPAVIPPGSLEDARSAFYAADRNTYGNTWEFVVHTEAAPEPTEYRVRIDNREYQISLARLVDLTTLASREGHAVWLCI